MKTGAIIKVTCITARNITPVILQCLSELRIHDAYLQRGKQVCLSESSGFFGMFPRSRIAEERSDITRFYIPQLMLDFVAEKIIMTADLQLPGRGSLFAENAYITTDEIAAGELQPESGIEKSLSAVSYVPSWHDYSVLTCIVQRGQGNDIVKSVLEMGLCVPVVSFGIGMGLRNRLGLLRVTIPVDKEILYLIVPAADAELVEGIAVHKARLDKPGKGFIYRTKIKAAVVNSRVRITDRRHVASMEQLIAAVDDLQGSTNWRRLSAHRTGRIAPQNSRLSCVSVVCDEGRVAEFVQASMDAGAGGATFVQLSHQDLLSRQNPGKLQGAENLIHARETCDLIVPDTMAERLIELFNSKGLFDGSLNGFVEVTGIEKAITYQP